MNGLLDIGSAGLDCSARCSLPYFGHQSERNHLRCDRTPEACMMPCPKDSSRTDSTGRAYAGSQRQIQTYVNERTQAFNAPVAQSLSRYNLNEKEIQWVSPIAADNYSEYRDSEFLERVGYGHLAPALREFWPQDGPCWDALARIEGGCL